MEAYLDGLIEIEMVEKHLPGVVVIVVQDSQVLLAKGYGYAKLDEGLPIDPENTLFRIDSVSKLFTWTAVMQLMEQGKVSLDTDVNQHLDFTIPEAFGKPVTIGQLMSHTAGFEDQGLGTWSLTAEQMMPLGDYLAANLPARLYYLQNRRNEALVELEPVLHYYEQLGIAFPILMEGQSIVPLWQPAAENGIHETFATQLLGILGAYNKPVPVTVPDTGATLTRREVEVLRLVMAGFSNQAIADELVISVWTVKSHLTQVYNNLDVDSRIQAIAPVIDLGLA